MNFGYSMPKAIIFDVDGTLYDQKKLRMFMLFEMTIFILFRPWCLKDFKLLWDFRKHRERSALNTVGDIDNQQYLYVARSSGVTPEKIRELVGDWILERPLKYLPSCRYPGVLELFYKLKQRGIGIGVFSDYPSEAKLRALGLSADVMVCSTDQHVDRLKPDPKGLLITAEKLGTPIEDCLFIGDRDEKDGECARRGGMRYLILNRKKTNTSDSFRSYHQLNRWLEV